MSALQIVLIAGGGYVAISILTSVAVMPVMRAAGVADLAEPDPHTAYPPPPASRPAPTPSRRVEPTYSSLSLERVTHHAATVLGASEACLAVRAHGTGER